jgi:hypothetical protein
MASQTRLRRDASPSLPSLSGLEEPYRFEHPINNTTIEALTVTLTTKLLPELRRLFFSQCLSEPYLKLMHRMIQPRSTTLRRIAGAVGGGITPVGGVAFRIKVSIHCEPFPYKWWIVWWYNFKLDHALVGTCRNWMYICSNNECNTSCRLPSTTMLLQRRCKQKPTLFRAPILVGRNEYP